MGPQNLSIDQHGNLSVNLFVLKHFFLPSLSLFPFLSSLFFFFFFSLPTSSSFYSGASSRFGAPLGDHRLIRHIMMVIMMMTTKTMNIVMHDDDDDEVLCLGNISHRRRHILAERVPQAFNYRSSRVNRQPIVTITLKENLLRSENTPRTIQGRPVQNRCFPSLPPFPPSPQSH